MSTFVHWFTLYMLSIFLQPFLRLDLGRTFYCVFVYVPYVYFRLRRRNWTHPLRQIRLTIEHRTRLKYLQHKIWMTAQVWMYHRINDTSPLEKTKRQKENYLVSSTGKHAKKKPDQYYWTFLAKYTRWRCNPALIGVIRRVLFPYIPSMVCMTVNSNLDPWSMQDRAWSIRLSTHFRHTSTNILSMLHSGLVHEACTFCIAFFFMHFKDKPHKFGTKPFMLCCGKSTSCITACIYFIR